MTPKIIELKQVPVVLVELPEGAICPSIGISVLGYFLEGRIIIDSRIKGKYEVEGFLSSLTEEQFSKCVEVTEYFDSYVHPSPIPAYKNYLVDNTYGWLAKDSFYSLLEYEKVYTENPHRHPDEIYTIRNKSNAFQRYSMKKWQEAQSRTIDPKRTVVLLRKEKTK